MKLLTVVGTRPELIRLSRVIARADQVFEHVMVHTGQNYDYELNGVFFNELAIRRPDHFLHVETRSLGAVLGTTLMRTEDVLISERPDAMLVLGDTNSCIAALMAKRMKIPVYHMEAGNRSFDENVPEETNRRMVDHVADFNLVYTEHARRNLLAEGFHPRRISMTGSPMREVLTHYAAQIAASDALENIGVSTGKYFLVSAHREENVDDPRRLKALLACLTHVRDRWDLPVHVSTHPRTRTRLEAMGHGDEFEGVIFHQPFGFLDFVKLQQHALCVLSDSGTISEESAILGFPAITLRESIERPEALDVGSMIMTGLIPQDVMLGVDLAIDRQLAGGAACPDAYEITDTSARVVNYIASTVRRHHDWAGIRREGGRG